MLLDIIYPPVCGICDKINKKNLCKKCEIKIKPYQINEIEKIKAASFDTIDKLAVEGNIENTGYYKKVTITDYADLEENQNDDTIISGLVKKVTVEISYKHGNNTETVDLSTVITKND